MYNPHTLAVGSKKTAIGNHGFAVEVLIVEKLVCAPKKKSGNQKPGLGGGRCKRLKFWGFRDRDTRHRERMRVEDVWSVF